MHIATQIRGGDMQEIFSHETLAYPQSQSRSGKMRSVTKTKDLIRCIVPDSIIIPINSLSKTTGAVLEGSVLVHLLKPKKNQKFKEFASETFYPQILKHKEL